MFRARDLDKKLPEVYIELGRCLLDAERLDEAIQIARFGIDLAPERGDLFHVWGAAAAAKAAQAPPGKRDYGEAITAFRRALVLNPEMSSWQFELSALEGATPETTPDSYVRYMFDFYATRFDEHLVKHLHYDVPAILLKTALSHRPAPSTSWDIMDLGCGTGLCGEVFRPFAKRLVGVDLSSNMIAVCAKRGNGKVYDELICGHLLEALQSRHEQFDVILAADVFIYVGALDAVFTAVSRALRPNGLFLFSLECHDGDGFVLQQQLRFAHSAGYIQTLADKTQFQKLSIQRCVLRDDAQNGLIVALERN